jgi:hypothetical protein
MQRRIITARSSRYLMLASAGPDRNRTSWVAAFGQYERPIERRRTAPLGSQASLAVLVIAGRGRASTYLSVSNASSRA